MKMKLIILLIISITLLPTASFSQKSYSLTTSNNVNLKVVLNQNSASKIYLTNLGNSKLVLKWKRILVNVPNDWIYATCDVGACYGGVPVGPTTMDSISVGTDGFVGIDIEPITTIGNGTIKLYVYQDGYEVQGDTLTWNITSQPVGIKEISSNLGINIYPNPASTVLNLKFSNEFNQKIESIYLIDAVGRKVKIIDYSNEDIRIDISDLNSGCYNLIVESENEKLFKKIIKSN